MAAELERRWEVALGALQTAEATYAHRVHPTDSAESALTPEVRQACLDIGRTLPDLWQTDILSQAQSTAALSD